MRAMPGGKRLWCLVVLLLLTAGVRAEDYGEALAAHYGLDSDVATNFRVEIIGQRIGLAAGVPFLRFAVFNNREFNALALPDGRIFITSAMAHLLPDDELAFVIGHEVTHIKERHAQSQARRATSGALLAAIIVAVLGGSESDIRLGADLAGGLTFGHYSRRDENRADAGGLRLMTELAYDPRQASVAMQRLVDRYGRGDAGVPVLGWFATHPDTENRKARLEQGAEQLVAEGVPALDPPLGITFSLEADAREASPWAHNYFSLALIAQNQGRAVVIPPLLEPVAVTAPLPAGLVLPAGQPANAARAVEEDTPKAEDEPLPPVTVTEPRTQPAYQVSLGFRPVPAGRAADFAQAKGTAVEVVLRWTDLRTGMGGTLAATAQTTEQVPWRATEQVGADALTLLSDGKQPNMEGTLQAAAIRRITRAFGEVLTTGGPVDHGAPVTIPLRNSGARPGDYVLVARQGIIVAEVRVDQVNRRDLTGTVLWGVHTWKKGDKFVVAP